MSEREVKLFRYFYGKGKSEILSDLEQIVKSDDDEDIRSRLASLILILGVRIEILGWENIRRQTHEINWEAIDAEIESDTDYAHQDYVNLSRQRC